MNPKAKDKVHVKEGNATWEGIVYTSGMFHLMEFSLQFKSISFRKTCIIFQAFRGLLVISLLVLHYIAVNAIPADRFGTLLYSQET